MADENLAEQIATLIRRDILRGKLPPGSSIKERDNAAELGVSRTPMREAIRILANEGLLILRPSRSPIVAQPSMKELADQVAVLLALEKLSVELACVHATDNDLDELAAITQYMADNFDTTDPLDMFEIDMSFHSAIAKASHNEPLAETHRSFLERLWRARFLAAIQHRNRERVVTDHGEILEALKSRDKEAARAAVDNHLWHLADDISAAIANEEKG